MYLPTNTYIHMIDRLVNQSTNQSIKQYMQRGPSYSGGDMFNPSPNIINKPWFLHVCSISLLKTMCDKEKFLVTSNFSFSQCFLPVWRAS